MSDVIMEQLFCRLCQCPGMGSSGFDVKLSTQASCIIVSVNVLGWGQIEVSRMQICPVFRAQVLAVH